jgi:hypothetical protein
MNMTRKRIKKWIETYLFHFPNTITWMNASISWFILSIGSYMMIIYRYEADAQASSRRPSFSFSTTDGMYNVDGDTVDMDDEMNHQ